jgi:hypothetical protein
LHSSLPFGKPVTHQEAFASAEQNSKSGGRVKKYFLKIVLIQGGGFEKTE